jgi:site-specific DNA-methyltransferase (adenine-specific)
MKPAPEVYNRITCGDALRVIPNLPARSVDLVVTDPPYGDNVGYGPGNIRIAGNEHPLLALQALALAYRVLKADTTAYLFCGMRHLSFVRSFFTAYTRYRIGETIIWDKVSMGVGPAFRKQYECILALEKGRPTYRDRRMLNLLSYRRVRDSAHPHAKPLELVKALIRHSSDEGGIVLDPFLGSGTTAVAALELGRRFVGIELDARYCALAKMRVRRAREAMGRVA